ncbi:hypothetical protein A3H22_00820 [Candidatus Peribacteria bacterium RIFCSPLOWO2_12_FULL_55_15]|nr:MAG: hypothetical protein A2789_00580 [Candidatus Peribacteria bacterium RIFCSPHIGHO2_01_FULL_54_22]OGJ63555.1 MAG: hypothetical protein A3D12_03855 [Candidatus Peribacteria bacterium RIFCSPHIGHO2_02_FULL_55_24]OGJ63826.1 MAG: hypothetical protein A3E47_01780 [Candidatus Peribacteria bacterium RIFCSPHIGHO2_12_FULL_54_10]OGJ67655.1 MAG: hypothetical protein A2947_00665 [Candidatus Peribacteria bacterium RIFCSPLOWO2_01_FULL_54_110]OGJ69542.1 MAG: hypothetical protein A3H90_02755 [Candidatus Pe
MEGALPTDLHTSQGVLSFREIHERFAATSYGKILAKNIRYRFFKPPEVSHAEWELLLGPDVNNLEHHWWSYRVMRAFLRWNSDFSREEQEVLLLTAVTHDWAEAIIGDIPYGQKTTGEEDDELHLIPQIALECFGEDIAQSVRQTIERVLREKPHLRSTGEGSKLGHAFEVVEQLGYLGTGGRAWAEATKREGLSTALRGNLQWLGVDIHIHHIPILLRYAETYPAVCRYLFGTRHRITDVLHRDIPSSLPSEVMLAKGDVLVQKSQVTRTVWERWLQAPHPVFSQRERE